MSQITYETEAAIFTFDLDKQQSRIPVEHEHFPYVAVSLLAENKGSAFCKRCQQAYSAKQLKLIGIGHGKNPLSPSFKQKGVIKNLFRKKPKLPGMFGGKGYACPKGHTLISVVTWMT